MGTLSLCPSYSGFFHSFAAWERFVAPRSGAPTAAQLDRTLGETRLWRQTRLAAS
jgi:hypothetical protein